MNETEYARKDNLDERTDHLTTAINDTREMIDNLQKHVDRQISFWGITISVIAFLFAGLQLGLAIFLYILTMKP